MTSSLPSGLKSNFKYGRPKEVFDHIIFDQPAPYPDRRGRTHYRNMQALRRLTSYASPYARTFLRSAARTAASRAGSRIASAALSRARSYVRRYTGPYNSRVVGIFRAANRKARRVMNKSRRRRIRARRARRRARRHRNNPYVNKRETNRRFVRSNRRRLYRAYRRRHRKFVPGSWYSLGRWYLFGHQGARDVGASFNGFQYIRTVESLSFVYNNNVNRSVFPESAGFVGNPISVGYDSRVLISGPHFNVASNPSEDNIVPSYIGSAAVGCSSSVSYAKCVWQYSDNSSNTDTLTRNCYMPPIPVKMFYFMNDQADNSASNYMNNAYGVGPTTATSVAVPYRCFWRKCYASINYSFKVSWDDVWASLGTNATAVTPANPPFYFRLIGVNADVTTLTAPQLCLNYFPPNSYITSKPSRSQRSQLRTQYGAFVFFDKLWMFNGRITPQFQSGEVLNDGEESSFTVPIPYAFSNSYYSINGSGVLPSFGASVWQGGSVSRRHILWFLFCGCVMPNWTYYETFNDQISAGLLDELCPKFSARVSFEYYCYPRYKEPVKPGTAELGRFFTSSGSSVMSTGVSKSVVEAASSDSPVPDSSGSGLTSAVSFLPHQEPSESEIAFFNALEKRDMEQEKDEKLQEKEQESIEVPREAQESPLLSTSDPEPDSIFHQDDPHVDQQI